MSFKSGVKDWGTKVCDHQRQTNAAAAATAHRDSSAGL